MSDRIILRHFTYRAEAEIVRELLEANGIEGFVISDDCGGVDPALQFGRGSNLLVAENDRAQAEELIEDSISEAATSNDES